MVGLSKKLNKDETVRAAGRASKDFNQNWVDQKKAEASATKVFDVMIKNQDNLTADKHKRKIGCDPTADEQQK